MLFVIAQGIWAHRGDRDAYLALRNRGVTAAAAIIRSSYDANGGDPNGWTRQVVLIPAASGPVQAVVGHHGSNKSDGAVVRVIYDPSKPLNARNLEDFREDDNLDLPATASIAVATCMALLAVATMVKAVAVPARFLVERRRQHYQLSLRA